MVINYINMKHFLYISAAMFIIILLIGVKTYPGSQTIYFIFSACSFLIYFSCLFQRRYLGILFLGFFLIMGFWFKINLYFIAGKSFVEPTGLFKNSADAWDEVLLITSIGYLGFVSSIRAFNFIDEKVTQFDKPALTQKNIIPNLYIKYRKPLYWACFIAAVIIPYLNFKLGIHQVGLTPKTILPWPLNAIISFAINFGLILTFSFFAFWDFKINKSILLGMILITLTSLLSSISALSRGMFIMQMAPYLVALIVLKKVNLKMKSIITVAVLFFLIASVAISNIFRASMYPDVKKNTELQRMLSRVEVLEGGIADVRQRIKNGEILMSNLQGLLKEKVDLDLKIEQYKNNLSSKRDEITNKSFILPENISKEFIFQFSDGIFEKILNLVKSRFVGVEGVMAMQSFPGKSVDKLIHALIEKRSLDKPAMYQEVAQSTYRYTDMSKWQFAALPGAIAFLYYSGSLVIVFLGMCLFGFIVMISEKMFYYLTFENLFVVSIVMGAISNSIAQFGIAPRQDLQYYIMIASCIFMFRIIIKYLNREKDNAKT